MRKLAMMALLAAMAAPVAVSAQSQPPQGGKDAVYDELNLFDQAFERIRQDSVDPVGDSKLVGAAINGMLTSLDPRAAYLDPAALKAISAPAADGEIGIGAALTMVKGEVRVISPRDGSPAAKAGIKPGDLILAINKEPTYEMNLPEVERKLRGPVGSTVKLTLQRPGSTAPLKLNLTRAVDHTPMVSARVVDGNAGYVRLAGFDESTPGALSAAVEGLRQQTSGRLQGLVIDLRNNPGGNFQDAVSAADDFLDKGEVALVKGHDANDVKHIAAAPNDLVKGLPIVVLVNGGTAEESELVAAALQENHRALLVGTKTFGESAIETLIPLSTGGAIRLTTAHFSGPDGKNIDGKGLAPDLVVTPLKLEKVVKDEGLHEADLPGALKNPDLAPPVATPQPPSGVPAKPGGPPAISGPAGATPGGPKLSSTATADKAAALAVTNQEIGGADDEQLTQALDILRGLAVFNRHASG